MKLIEKNKLIASLIPMKEQNPQNLSDEVKKLVEYIDEVHKIKVFDIIQFLECF